MIIDKFKCTVDDKEDFWPYGNLYQSREHAHEHTVMIFHGVFTCILSLFIKVSVY